MKKTRKTCAAFPISPNVEKKSQSFSQIDLMASVPVYIFGHNITFDEYTIGNAVSNQVTATRAFRYHNHMKERTCH